ncbi:5-Enolpyruvylshikimate-3-phosphate synthase [Fulvivirga imtechensis AK7]|uniref:3-phosphoshikimate 1-carboxyvinyltransferase n=1 Tax=Fulvivirga imtechensis AK7 TaxID=1237149 RepID=L8JV88_9BACT|nr:3-phosphoshikimate 1-carboxyvinyltransferase [Fulvivirga imtechensis]ELR72700.1 5-Enolpyruvylshikimate-3-phosphate synthase [Fulvivirga imtechensis AK7]
MKENTLYIKKHSRINSTVIMLPASKSIANRALIIDALAGKKSPLKNVSEARDTVTMQRLLNSDGPIWDVLDAGTTMRFLTAYAAVRAEEITLTGTKRMQERPIKILADSLQELGADIKYLNNEGYPPIKIKRIKDQLTSRIKIRGDISSQYISALLMIAPELPEGLTIELTGHIGSRPYIKMTLAVMKAFGVNADWKENIINIPKQSYHPAQYTVEPDWSAASYWYSFAALSEDAEIILKDLKDDSIQGDRRIADYMSQLGVSTEFTPQGAHLSKKAHEANASFDFTDCPDMAQTVAVICAAKGITCKMTGLESLRIKETDRIAALQTELSKFGARLEENEDQWLLVPAHSIAELRSPEFDTYHDHRMAMAFAPLSTLGDIKIKDPEVVNKSYPGFWKDMNKAGFKISEL